MNIFDVAKEAGVSVATVSRVLNDESVVSDSTKKKVNDAVKKLNYHPNLAGRNLRKNETRLILIIMNSLINPLFAKIISGIEETAEKNGYNVLLCTTDNQPEKIEKHLGLLSKKIADGAILLSIEVPDYLKKSICRIAEATPIVQCCEYQSDVKLPIISIDNYKAMYDATEYLIKKGRRKLLHISCENEYTSTVLRFNGYRDALLNNGIEFNPDFVIKGNYGFRNATKITSAFLESGKTVDGVLANSDKMAAGAIKALEESGLKIPHDVCVMGFDNSSFCHMFTPSISSVSQSQKQLGVEAFEAVLSKIKNTPCKSKTILDHELIIRKSTEI